MKCSKCNTENQSGSKYCTDCGEKLIDNSEALNLQSKYFLWYLCWIYFGYVFWFIYRNYVDDLFFSENGTTNWDAYRSVAEYADWSITTLDVLFLFLIAYLITNKNYRLVIIFLAILRIGIFAGYYFYN